VDLSFAFATLNLDGIISDCYNWHDAASSEITLGSFVVFLVMNIMLCLTDFFLSKYNECLVIEVTVFLTVNITAVK